MKGFRWAVGALVAAMSVGAGCGPIDANGDGIADGVREPDTVSLIAPSTPVGSVSGKVLTTRMSPLDGAAVMLNVLQRADKEGTRAPLSGTTDGEGSFFITGVPAGVQVEVTVKKDGFATLRTVTTVPAAAGNFPINDGNAQVGPYAVTALDGSLRFNVFTRSGRPAHNLRVVIEASPAATALLEADPSGNGSPYGAPMGVVVSEGTIDASGQVTLSGVPTAEEVARLGGKYLVIIPSFDENGDGILDSAGQVLEYSGEDFIVNGSARTIRLEDARVFEPLRFVATNVPAITAVGTIPPAEAMVRPTDALYFAFNHALLPGSINAVVVNEAGNEQLTTSAALSSDGTVLTVTSPSPWADGKEFNVLIRATSADTGEVLVRRGWFWGGDPLAPTNVTVERIEFVDGDSNGSLSYGESVYVYFSSPVVPRSDAGAEALYLFYGADIGGGGVVGDYHYEIGAPTDYVGSYLSPSEPMGPDMIFNLRPSGYTGRWSFAHPVSNEIPQGTPLRIDFARLKNTTSGYYSNWGALLTSNLSSTLTRRVP